MQRWNRRLVCLAMLLTLPFPAAGQEPEGAAPVASNNENAVSAGGLLDGLFQRREGSAKPRKKPQPAPSREQSRNKDNTPALFSLFSFGAKRAVDKVDSLAEASAAPQGNSPAPPPTPADQPPPLPMANITMPAQPIAMIASRPMPLAERAVGPPSAAPQPVARPGRPVATSIPPHALLVADVRHGPIARDGASSHSHASSIDSGIAAAPRLLPAREIPDLLPATVPPTAIAVREDDTQPHQSVAIHRDGQGWSTATASDRVSLSASPSAIVRALYSGSAIQPPARPAASGKKSNNPLRSNSRM